MKWNIDTTILCLTYPSLSFGTSQSLRDCSDVPILFLPLFSFLNSYRVIYNIPIFSKVYLLSGKYQ